MGRSFLITTGKYGNVPAPLWPVGMPDTSRSSGSGTSVCGGSRLRTTVEG